MRPAAAPPASPATGRQPKAPAPSRASVRSVLPLRGRRKATEIEPADESLVPESAPARWLRRQPVLPIAIGSGLAVLCLAGVALISWYHPVPRATESALRAQSGLTFWKVEISKDGQHMTVHAPGLRSKSAGYHYQLWAWPEKGEPTSLVPLPTAGQAEYDLDPTMQQALGRAHRVAVTVEASGAAKGPRRVILIAPLEASTASL